jgi:hypothetical protein
MIWSRLPQSIVSGVCSLESDVPHRSGRVKVQKAFRACFHINAAFINFGRARLRHLTLSAVQAP